MWSVILGSGAAWGMIPGKCGPAARVIRAGRGNNHAMSIPSPSSNNPAPARPEPRPERTRSCRSVLRRLLVIAGSSYLVWCAVLLVVQESLIFPRWSAGEPTGRVPDGAEQVWITTLGGARIEGLYFPSPGRDETPGPAVIYAHGNGELIDQCVPIARMYNEWGVSVLLPEYRGYGASGGAPSQEGIGADFVAFHDWLTKRPEVDEGAIVLHGRSLGGGVAAQLAAERRPAALLLECTFTSIASFSWSYGVPPMLVRHPFRTDRVVTGLASVPMLIMHGTTDTIVPVWHGRRLSELAPHAAYYETDDHHLNFPTDERAYRARLLGFLREHGIVPADDIAGGE